MMKETIYTIPVTEAFQQDCFCPFCAIHDRLNEEEVKYALGPAMMEPDYRAITNKKGFCQEHMKLLGTLPKALAMSLVLQSHLDSFSDLLSFDLPKEKKGLFTKKNAPSPWDNTINGLESKNNSCAICDRINYTLGRYIDTFLYLIKTDEAFLKKAVSRGGFCMPHFGKILSAAKDSLSSKDFDRVIPQLAKAQQKEFERMKTQIQDFIDSFDYQNAGKPSKAPQDTVHQSCCFLAGEFDPPKKILKDI